MPEGNLCPVCGYGGLYEQPWTGDSPSDEICPSCGTHFGYDDVTADPAGRWNRHAALRQSWKAEGCRWFSNGRPQPVDWDPLRQLEAVEQ